MLERRPVTLFPIEPSIVGVGFPRCGDSLEVMDGESASVRDPATRGITIDDVPDDSFHRNVERPTGNWIDQDFREALCEVVNIGIQEVEIA